MTATIDVTTMAGEGELVPDALARAHELVGKDGPTTGAIRASLDRSAPAALAKC